jgi:hypothetical protein
MRGRAEAVIAAYRPKPGKESELRKLVRQHRLALDDARLVSSKPTILLRARSDGTVLEIFEWKSAKAADEAHQNPALRALWGRFVKIADFIPLSAIRESDRAFSHFETWGVSQPDARQLARKRPAAKRSKR